MKGSFSIVITAVKVLTLLLLVPQQSFGLEGVFDERYGHVNPSCDGEPITNTVTLDELMSQGNSNDPISVPCGYRATTIQGNKYYLSNGLEVYGELVFTDNDNPTNSGEETIVEAPYILVRGHLQAGTQDEPYNSKLRFVLTEFQNKSDELIVPSLSDNPLFQSPMNFGDKAFVVYGGTISLCGPVEKKNIFAKLASNVESGTNQIVVKGKWNSHWKNGDHLVITATSDILKHGDDATWWAIAREVIVSSSQYKKKKDQTRLSLSEDFFIDRDDVEFESQKVETRNYKGRKVNVLLGAEIFKLTRNIVIQGIPAGSDMADFIKTQNYHFLDPNPLGGHFVVAHTPRRQVLQGVEFSAMGQPGILGRYPIHFHSCGNIDSRTVVKFNSIHHSKQRCVVVHATNGLTVKQNAAFWADNNCYMTEDGYEHSNSFIANIAANVQRSPYWMANPSNDLINNIAANSPFGYEIAEPEDLDNFSFKHKIPCQTGGWSDANGCTLPRFLAMGKFKGNVAHNVGTGLQIYPPRFPLYPLETDHMDVVKNLFLWNVNTAYDSVSSNIKIDGLRLIGAGRGLNIDTGMNVMVKKSVFQDVCRGVRIKGDFWNRMHSGIELNRVVFNRVWERDRYWFDWEEPENCAPIVFRSEATRQYSKVSAQIKNTKLYGVKKLFSLDRSNGFDEFGNTQQYGFFVHNVLSFDSDLKHISPASSSYIIRHGYQGNLVIDDNKSLVKNCDNSIIGGYPNSDQFYLCKDQCWRPIALLFKPVLGDNVPISIKFVSESGNVFFINETKSLERPCNNDDIHIVQVIPSDNYKIFLVNSNMDELSGNLHEQADIRYYHADQKFDGFEETINIFEPNNFEPNLNDVGCLESLTLEFNGNNLPASDFKACNSYWS